MLKRLRRWGLRFLSLRRLSLRGRVTLFYSTILTIALAFLYGLLSAHLYASVDPAFFR